MTDHNDDSQRDLAGAQAAAKIRELAENSRMCMFTTAPGRYPPDVRPMATQAVEDDGTIWFISASDSEKNSDIASDPRVVLTFQNDDKYQYLSVCGQARVHTDRATIDKYWSSMANVWFDGKDDPRVTVIAVEPTSGHYWETESGKIVTFARMTFSALTGGSSANGSRDGGVSGELKP